MKKKSAIFVLMALLSIGALGQDNDKIISKEIVKVFENSGEQGLSLWMKQNKNRVPPDIIITFAKRGVYERSKSFLTIALVPGSKQRFAAHIGRSVSPGG